jgi:hypothetical protein
MFHAPVVMILAHKGTRRVPNASRFADMMLSYAHWLEDFAVLEEAYREIIEDKLEIAHIQQIVWEMKRRLHGGSHPWRRRAPCPSASLRCPHRWSCRGQDVTAQGIPQEGDRKIAA